MNVHAPDNATQEKWNNWEWVGKRWQAGGLTWIRARHKGLGWKHWYCFEQDIFWDLEGYKFYTLGV